MQLGYTMCYDARQEDAWQHVTYNDSDWTYALTIAGPLEGYWTELLPRPVPPLQLYREDPVQLVMQGDFIRTGERETVAATMACDALITRTVIEQPGEQAPLSQGYTHRPGKTEDRLTAPDDTWMELLPPPTGISGRFLVLDLGQEETGLITGHIQAPTGTILDIAHGEHLDDGRVRTTISERNFADRVICAEGETTFTLPFRRVGARYLQVHISNYTTPLRINYFGLKPAYLPLELPGEFTVGDPLAERMHVIAVRTLLLCMHEHYEDCPWREQSLYAGDGRVQALYGYYTFGNYEFAEASLDLLGRGFRDDGLLELCAPARVPVTIPCFTLLWVTAVADHWLYSGRRTLYDRFAGYLVEILDAAYSRFDEDTGLYRVPSGKEIWNFYDWMDGLAGTFGDTDPGTRHHALYNLYLHEALRNYQWMLEQDGAIERAQEIQRRRQHLGEAITRTFWNAANGLMASFTDGGNQSHYADLVQVFAFAEGLVPAGADSAILTYLQAQRLYPMTLYSLLYQALALRTHSVAARTFMAQTIRSVWEPMVLAGATTFWETAIGGSDFANAGSLCHGWSALPAYYYQHWVLGVRPLAPGFTRFAICPFPDRFSNATGTIPTPAGAIHIHWERRPDGIAIIAGGPSSCHPIVEAFPEAPVVSAIYNGVQLSV